MIVAEYLHGVVSYFRWSLVVSALFVGYIQICCGSIPIKKGQFMSIPQVFFWLKPNNRLVAKILRRNNVQWNNMG